MMLTVSLVSSCFVGLGFDEVEDGETLSPHSIHLEMLLTVLNQPTILVTAIIRSAVISTAVLMLSST